MGTSSQAKGTNSTSFLTHKERKEGRNEVELVPLACEDDMGNSFQDHS